MKALRMHIIGTSGYTPYPSKTARLFTSCRLFFGNKSLQIDIGNKYSGLPVDYLLVTHCHYDHIQAIETLPEMVQILIPSLTFEGTLKKKEIKSDIRVFKTKIDLDGLEVKPFPVLHSSTTMTYGFKFFWNNKTMVWLPDWCVIPGYSEIFRGLDYLFLGAAAMKKPISHKGYGHCQGAVYHMLEKISQMNNPPKKIFLIHYGQGLRPIKIKVHFLQQKFPSLKIQETFDGQRIVLD